MKKVLFVLLLLALLVSAFFPIIINKALSDNAMEEAAEYYIDLLINGNYEAIISDMDPQIRQGNEMELFFRMGQFFPEQAPTSINLVGHSFMRSIRQPARYFFTYQYEYEQKWILVNVGFRKTSSERKEIVFFNVTPIDQSLQETHRFSLQGKDSIHYIFLFICVACPLFILYTLITCIRTKLKKRKWLWIIFILVGFVQFSLNWTTGQIWAKLLSFQILGAGAVTASVYAPWILSFSIPVGAIIFWIKLKNIRKEPIPEGPESAANGVSPSF